MGKATSKSIIGHFVEGEMISWGVGEKEYMGIT